MLNTNGNRKPKTALVKTGVESKVVWAMRSFLSNGTSADVSKPGFEKETGLTKEEALAILAEKQRKNADVFSLVSGKKKHNVSIYIVEKAAIRSIVRHSGEYSDDVELEPDYYFKDEAVESKKAKMYVLNGKVIVIQHRDEIALFERENRKATFVAEVDVKESDKDSVTVKVDADYRSSAAHAAKLNAALEADFIHLEASSRSDKNAVDVKVYSVSKNKEKYKYTTRSFAVAENIADLKDGLYKAKLDGIEKVLAISTEAFTNVKTFLLFSKGDAPIADKEVAKAA